jgi:hypothetical protein
MGLIVLALVQALIYNVMCRRKEDELAGPESPATHDGVQDDGPGDPGPEA